MPEPIRNMGASVRARLLNLAKGRNQPFELLLTRYVLERLLYRLSISQHRKRFVPKGAMLMTIWFDDPLRPTRDLDLLGFGDADADEMLAVFREICAMEQDDGVIFDTEALAADQIRDELEYGGLRIKTNARIGGARIRVVIDIGFGDAIEPGIAEMEVPVLLEQPAPHLRIYPRETAIAEKFQAMVALGRANSRMKDFYDIWALSRAYDFDADRLARAIAASSSGARHPSRSRCPMRSASLSLRIPPRSGSGPRSSKGSKRKRRPLPLSLPSLRPFLIPHARTAREQ